MVVVVVCVCVRQKCWFVVPIDFDDELVDLEMLVMIWLLLRLEYVILLCRRPPNVDSLSAVYLGRVINCLARYESSYTNVIVDDVYLPKINCCTLACPLIISINFFKHFLLNLAIVNSFAFLYSR